MARANGLASTTWHVTTISRLIQRMGSGVLSLLIDVIEGKNERSTHLGSSTELVVRDSACAPARPKAA